MASAKKQKKIIWALDPFEKTDDTTGDLVSNLRQLAKAQGAKIEPVYVLSPDVIDVNVVYPDTWFKKYRPITEKVIAQYLKSFDIPELLPPRILTERRGSIRAGTETLLKYAKKSGAQMIAVGTHARKGISRLLLGSFSETVILYSKIPVLVVGTHSADGRAHQKIEEILYATDFSKNSSLLFEKVLKLAKSLQAKVTLLHAVPHPIEPVFQSGVYLLSGAWVTLPELLTSEEERKRALAKRYQEMAKRKNVVLKVVFDSDHTGVSQIILKNAESKKSNLIALAAESGLIKSALIGSIAREVVRTAPCPVWIVRK